jgi:hypothetical protein
MLDDAFSDTEGEVETTEGGVTLLEPGDDAQGVQVVVEGQAVSAQAKIECLLAGVTEGWMADVVGEGESFSEFNVEAEGIGKSTGDLGDFKGVGEAAAKVVGWGVFWQAGEDLGFAGKAAKGARVENAGGVASERRAIGVERLGMGAVSEVAVRITANGYGWRESCGRGGFRCRHILEMRVLRCEVLRYERKKLWSVYIAVRERGLRNERIT